MKTITANITTAMRRILIILLAVTLVIIMIPNPFATTKSKSKAKTKKITIKVNRVVTGNKKIQGRITINGKKVKNANKYRIIIRKPVLKENGDKEIQFGTGKVVCQKKKYQAKVRKNGKFTVSIPKLKTHQEVKVSLYKGKKFKRTKWIKVEPKDVEITKNFWNKFLNTTLQKKAKLIGTQGPYGVEHEATGNTPYYRIWNDSRTSRDIGYTIGNVGRYIKDVVPFEADTDYVEMKAINGATIYLNILWGGGEVTDTYQEFKKALEDGVDTEWGMGSDGLALLEQWYQAAKPWDWKDWQAIPEPSPQSYQYKILPGQSVRFYGKDFPELSPARECLLYKATVYVKGKFVAATCDGFDHSPQGYKLEWR